MIGYFTYPWFSGLIGESPVAFTAPTFNIVVDWWNLGHTPSGDPPDFYDVPAQLYLHSRGDFDQTPGTAKEWVPVIQLRMPSSWVLTTAPPWVGGYVRYKDALSNNWYYLIRWWEYCHAGFSNEYVVILLDQCDILGTCPDAGR